MKKLSGIVLVLALVLSFSVVATTPVAAGTLAAGTTSSIVGTYYPVDFTVTDDGSTVTWTFDMKGDRDLVGNGHWGYGLAISLDGVEPAFQIHNNDGTDSGYAWGTHLYSPYLSAWVSGTTNTPVSALDWVTCTGARYIGDNADGVFTVTIDKAELGVQFYWAIWFGVGGFWSPNNGYSSHPNGFIWGTDVATDGYQLCTLGVTAHTGPVYFTPSAGVIANPAYVPEASLPTAGKPNLSFPHGFFEFDITGLTSGQTVTVTITLPSAVPVGTQYWKYHASEGGWIQIPMGSDDGDNVITITLVDGGLGDDDGTADGTIVDQGGPGTPRTVGWEGSSVDKAAVMVPWIALMAAMMAGALLVVRRRRVQI